MINSDKLQGVQHLYQVLRTICLADLDIESYRMGKNGLPVVIMKPGQEIEKRLRLEQRPTERDGYLCLQFYTVSIIWKVETPTSQKEAQV